MTSSRIISEKFTGLDAWPFGFRRLCVPCGWAYSRAPTTQPGMLITATTVTEYRGASGAAELGGVLAAGALTGRQAAVVPTTMRRHILPTAEWGHVATDGFVASWDGGAAARLADLAWLRSLGARWPQLCKPAPPHRLMTSQPSDQWGQIMAAWEHLRPWRAIPPMWDLGRILTNTNARTGGGE
ncbi:MAG: hypothetical protein WDA30_27690 [Mycolicibacterium sp.]